MKKVLVVDHNRDILEIISSILELQGYTVACRDNGIDLVEVAKKAQPNLIILDLMLKGIGGLDLCKALKLSEFTSHIPIILISGSRNIFDTPRLPCTPDGFISSPVDADDLIRKVRKLICE